VEEAEAADKPTKITVFGREEDSFRRVERVKAATSGRIETFRS